MLVPLQLHALLRLRRARAAVRSGKRRRSGDAQQNSLRRPSPPPRSSWTRARARAPQRPRQVLTAPSAARLRQKCGHEQHSTAEPHFQAQRVNAVELKLL